MLTLSASLLIFSTNSLSLAFTGRIANSVVERQGRWFSGSTIARTVYDGGNLASRLHFANVITNQMNIGLPVRYADTRYLNAQGVFDLKSLVDVMSSTSDLQGACLPEKPFVAKPYCWEDMPLVASVIQNVQKTQHQDIEHDATLPAAVVSDVVDNVHTFILAAR